MTLDQYDAMLEAQDGSCAICGKHKKSADDRSMHVDHDHRTGKVRAILCYLCNVGLANFRETPALFLAAVDYLERHRDGRAVWRGKELAA